MAKIAMAVEHALAERMKRGAPGEATARTIARGDGWVVSDIICTSGPRDRAFEERHSLVSIALVIAGSFQYRSPTGRALMTPGSVLLGNPGHCFECGHEHGVGDRCLSFQFAPDLFARIAADAGARGDDGFQLARMPPIREMSPIVARACARLLDAGSSEVDANAPEPGRRVAGAGAASSGGSLQPEPDAGSLGSRRPGETAVTGGPSWEELAIAVAARTAWLARGLPSDVGEPPADASGRVTRIVRAIERGSEQPLPLADLARSVGLSPFHFLRTFERVTGVTPHQFLLRVRLRDAALRLTQESTRILDIALDSGFGDVSNFNRTFRTEFGLSPRRFRQDVRR